MISKSIITFDLAEEFLNDFKEKYQASFPFVVVPEHMSLDMLRRERPFLLLSVLTCAAQNQFKLQDALELELRESLGRKVHVLGEKSLDLLQGVLVYLAW